MISKVENGISFLDTLGIRINPALVENYFVNAIITNVDDFFTFMYALSF